MNAELHLPLQILRMTLDERVSLIRAMLPDLGEARLLQVLSAIRHEVSAIELAREFSQPAE